VPQTLNEWVKHEIDTGSATASRHPRAQRIKALEREVKELRRANEILKLASAFFAQAELDRRSEVLKDFVDQHREAYGVEPICKVLQIAPSAIGAMRPISAIPSCAAQRASVTTR
jgi:hypothetical protein